MAARTCHVETAVGTLCLHAEGDAIIRLDWDAGGASGDTNDPLLAAAAEQLAAYFAGDRQRFDLTLAPHGTAHDKAVWHEMQKIAYGATRSYGELARAIASSPRAVGTACGRNPIPVIIPCHRVLAANGGIGGYSGAGGTATKHRLLALEGSMLPL